MQDPYRSPAHAAADACEHGQPLAEASPPPRGVGAAPLADALRDGGEA